MQREPLERSWPWAWQTADRWGFLVCGLYLRDPSSPLGWQQVSRGREARGGEGRGGEGRGGEGRGGKGRGGKERGGEGRGGEGRGGEERGGEGEKAQPLSVYIE